MYENNFPHKRFGLTLEFLEKHIPKTDTVLDLGVENPFTLIMKEAGYQVSNTGGEDLDNDTSSIEIFKGEVVTAFEIFEHLVSPYTSLKAIPCDKCIISVPLKLWFSSAYRNKNDILFFIHF